MSNLFRTIKGVEYIRRDEYGRLLEKLNTLEAGLDQYHLIEETIYDTRGEDPDTGGQTVLTYKNKFVMKFRPSTKDVADSNHLEIYMNSREDNPEFRGGWNGKGWYIDWDRQLDIDIVANLSEDEFNILKHHLKVWDMDCVVSDWNRW